MSSALWAALGGGAAVLLVLLGVALAVPLALRRARAHERAAFAAARADVEHLRAQVEQLSAELAAARGATPAAVESEYLITTAGTVDQEPSGDLTQVPGRAVLSVTVGEPLVKLAAFGYGLRRAASAESRNRIAFQMRREVRRVRKERRRAARRARVAAARTEGAA